MATDYEDIDRGSFDTFVKIVAALRGENGCPWDRAQTFESLKPCMIHEMTEAVAGIDLCRASGDAANLCEELGDVLLQVVLLAQIAQEEGLFSIEDVVRGIGRKMLRRHPHVFGDSDKTPLKEEIPGLWEAVKREEKKSRTPEQERMEQEAYADAARQVIKVLDHA